jgi:hypothetical protein
MIMDNDEQRDHAEEQYNRDLLANPLDIDPAEEAGLARVVPAVRRRQRPAGTVDVGPPGSPDSVRFWLGEGSDDWIECRIVGDLRAGVFRLEVHAVSQLAVRPKVSNEISVELEQRN